MATTGVLIAKDVGVYVDVGGVKTLVACATSAKLSFSREMRKRECRDIGDWAEYVAGEKEWEIATSYLVAFDAAMGLSQLYDAYDNGDKLFLRMGTEVTGDIYFEGNAFVKDGSLDSSGKYEDVTSDVGFRGTGQLTKGLVPA